MSMKGVCMKNWKVAVPISCLAIFATIPVSSQTDEPTALQKFMQIMGRPIPFPPEKMIDLLKAQNIPVTGSVFPFGRSLERRVTDYDKPRSLVAFAPDPQKPSDLVFIAYTSGNAELQIIAKNAKTKEFDFRVIDNYTAGKKPVSSPPAMKGLVPLVAKVADLFFYKSLGRKVKNQALYATKFLISRMAKNRTHLPR